MDMITVLNNDVTGMSFEDARVYFTEVQQAFWKLRREVLSKLKSAEAGESVEDKMTKLNTKTYSAVWTKRGKAGVGTKTITADKIVMTMWVEEIVGDMINKVAKLAYIATNGDIRTVTISSVKVIEEVKTVKAKARGTKSRALTKV